MGEASGSSTHDLLLAMAGQVDDDLLAWARELVAVGENTRAIALVTAGVTADRTALPAPLRAALVAAARTAQTDLDAGSALPAASDTALGHRFAAAPSGGDERVAAAVGALPARLLDGAEVQLAWRLTPAGSAPGPLPHPVVLVEVEPGGRPADVLAYQLSVALDRSGVVASVEVLTSGNPLSEYHTAARAAALRVHGAAATPTIAPSVAAPPVIAPPVTAPVEPEPAAAEPATPGYADLWAAEGPFAVPAEPSEPDTAAATDPTGDVIGEITPAPRPVPLRAARESAPAEPEPRPTPRPFERRRTTVTPLTRSSLPSPVPLARRDGNRVRPLVPVTDVPPVDDTTDGPAAEATDTRQVMRPNGGGDAFSSLDQGQIPALADTPMFRSMQDPLSGPLNAPLLAPLLDPTPLGEQSAPAEDEDDDPFGLHGISPLAPDRPTPATAPVEDRWAGEWASGEWALSASDLSDDQPADQPEPEPAARDAAPDEDEVPRHRAAFEWAGEPSVPTPPVAPPSPPAAVTPPSPFLAGPPRTPPPVRAPQPPTAPQARPEPPAAVPPRPPGPDRTPAQPPAARAPEPAAEGLPAEGLGLRPDSVARLSDADRELLARLQAELGTGTRPRTSRRAGVAAPNGSAPNGSSPNGNGNGNGSGRHDPPDLAG